MNRRFVATAFIALTVVFSQGGGSALAAICPHLRSLNTACHEMQTQEVNANHHEVERANGHAFDRTDSTAPCNHCAVHSRTKRDDSTLQPANTSQRASDLTISMPGSVAGPPPLSKAIAWVAKAHGPPRDAGPLHLLNNVFRI
ncbi:MAG: hypothetical protein LC794_05325 [Acidobacteria bacterium]|nr:hypothetical protein [Acidobacteriota bacterium]